MRLHTLCNLPDRVIPQFLKCGPYSMHFDGTIILLYSVPVRYHYSHKNVLQSKVHLPNGKSRPTESNVQAAKSTVVLKFYLISHNTNDVSMSIDGKFMTDTHILPRHYNSGTTLPEKYFITLPFLFSKRIPERKIR